MLRNAVDNFTRRYSKNELVSALTADQKMLEHINEKFAQLLSETAMQQNKKSAAETQQGDGARFELAQMGLEKFNNQIRNEIKVRGGIVINSEKELKKHIAIAISERNLPTKKKNKENLYLGAISEDVKKKIELDVGKSIFKDKQYSLVISSDDIIHLSEHFGNEESVISKEILKIYDIIKNYDSVTLVEWENAQRRLAFDKHYPDYDYRTIEIVSKKKTSLDFASLFITRNNIKRGGTVPPVAVTGDLQWGSNTSIDSIFNPDGNVNTSEEKNSENSSGVNTTGKKVRKQKSLDLYSEYDKPITIDDVNVLRGIGRKSINEFTNEDIQKSQKWAHKFYKELGVKSPFFRAWFGDWRSADINPVSVSNIPEYVDSNEERKKNRGNVKNSDTGWEIRISRNGETNTISHAGEERLSEYGLAGIRELVENAILLDTEVHEHHNNNAKNDLISFDHKLYALGNFTDNSIGLYKITVEEFFQSKEEPGNKRFHNLKYIEKVAELSADALSDYTRSGGSTNDNSTTNYSVSDLYSFVKMYDENFTPAPEVNPFLLNEDGTPKVFYHGSKKGGGFSVFKNWQYFTENKPYAERYAERGNDKSLYSVYLIANKIFDTRNAEARKIFESIRSEYGLGELQDTGLPDWTDGYDISDYLDEHPELGYDAVLLDEGGDLINGNPVSRGLSIVIKNSEQIKSATDNIGTFDGGSTDVRFQMSADSVRDEELRMIRQDYELTKLQNDLMRAKLKVYEHKVPSPKALRRYLNNVIKWYGVQYNDAEKLQAFEKLSEIYKYLVQSKTPNMATVQDMAFDLARDMIDYSAELIKEPYSDAERDLRRTLRETGLCLSEAQKSEIIYSYGSMTNFRRATGGMIRINKDSKLYVADIMREAKEIYDIKTDNEDEFLVELIPYMKASAEAARGVWADPYQGDAKAAHMAAMDLSSLLLDALFDPNIVPARRTFADMEEEKRYRALLNQYSYYEKRMAKLNDRVRQARAEGRQAVQNERGRREAAIKEMAEHYAQMTYKAQERRKSSELKAKIARLADSINGRLINPKKDRYIPQDIQQAIIPALELAANYTYGAERLEKYDRMIAAEPNEERRQRLVKIRDKIAKYGDNISSAIKDLKDLYDAGRPRTDSNGEELNADNPYDAAKQSAFNPAISELLNTVYNQLNGVSCNQMSSEQLQLLYNALRATDKVIRDSVNLRSSRIKMSVYDAGEELIRETSAIKGSKRGLASSLLQQNLNPESFFERLGGFAKNSLWMKTYDDLNDAQRDNKANQKRIAYRKRT